ncbi:MAG TPA: PEP-CTERM sorting domain-containing protein [Casimicrobiaceae bacterium]|jgi:hypothetical protein
MNIQSLMRRALLALAAGAALCSAPAVLATAVTLHPTGFANGSESFNFNVATVVDPNAVPTGAFTGTIDGGPPITFFCFELTQSFSFGSDYSYDDSVQSGGKYTTLSELFTEAFATSTTSTLNSAAFQLAVWEILEETTPGSLSPGASQGDFYVTNDHGNTTTVAAANALIAGLPSTGGYTIHLLHSDTNQDFVYGVPPLLRVPEPASVLLIAGALAAMLFALRRRPLAAPV